MSRRTLATTETTNAMTPAAPVGEDVGHVLHGVAKELAGAIEQVSDNIGQLASALNGLANATALSIIATHGKAEDRTKAVANLKAWFEDFRE
jgi:hypothetical protein